MRQIALNPAGCQPWYTHVVGAGGDRFAYCSTLAIYVFLLDKTTNTFFLEKILSGHTKTITSISWCPSDSNYLASISLDKSLIIWSIKTATEVRRIELNDTPLFVDWCPRNQSQLAIAFDKDGVRVVDHEANSSTQVLSLRADVSCSVVRWSEKEAGILLAGTGNGTIQLVDLNGSKPRRVVKGDGQAVRDIRWDPLSDAYFLAAFSDGSLALYDKESGDAVTKFDKQAGGVRTLCFEPGVPGGFVTTDARSGVVRFWNVSQKNPTNFVKLKKIGLQNLAFVNGQRRALTTFKDGSVGLYNFDTSRWEYQSELGHTETVFDCKFKPNNSNILATASFDGSIKLWDLNEMKASLTLQGQDGIVYCVSWAPGNDDRLCSATYTGRVLIWDAVKGQLLNRLAPHKEVVYRCAWNKKDVSVLATTSKDGTCAIINTTDLRLIKRFRHPRAAYGVDWCPDDPQKLATGCHDGKVRVWTLGLDKPVIELVGHKSRVFNVAWSPLIPDTLLSGADDHTAIVWNTRTGAHKVLKGHRSNVRGLLWSSEVPWLCYTGSWDGTIRTWDTRSGECLEAVADHQVDVYGLALHPDRPFLIASTSRDTTIRLWDDIRHSKPLRTRLLAGENPSNMSGSHSASSDSIDLLCSGRIMNDLANVWDGSLNDRIGQVMQKLYFRTGFDNLWALAIGNVQPEHQIKKIDTLLESEEKRLDALEASVRTRFGAGVGGTKKEDVLREVAAERLRMGDFKKYCDLSVQVGDWEKAIAVAPAVSLSYWKYMCGRYAAHLGATPYGRAIQLASGETAEVVHNLCEDGHCSEALLPAVATLNGRFVSALDGEKEEPKLKTGAELEYSTCVKWASHLVHLCDPVRAASVLLARGDNEGCLAALSAGAEIDLAFALSTILDSPRGRHLALQQAWRMSALGRWKEAINIIRNNNGEPLDFAHLLLIFTGTKEEKAALMNQACLPPMDRCAFVAKDLLHSDPRQIAYAIALLTLGDDPTAVDKAVEFVKEKLSSDAFEMTSIKTVLDGVCSAGDILRNHPKREEFNALSAVTAAILAVEKGFVPIIERATLKAIELLGTTKLSVSPAFVALNAAQYFSLLGDRPSASLFAAQAVALSSGTQFEEPSKYLLDHLGKNDITGPHRTNNTIIAAGASLPSSLPLSNRFTSAFTSLPIQGPTHMYGTNMYASVGEALMWHQCCSLSPAFDCSPANPFS